MRYFNSNVIIDILPNSPPSVVGKIDDVVGYQGQSMVIQKNINLYDLFYDPSDKLNFAMIECIDNLTDSIASTMMRYIEISKTIESTFYKSYTGICKAHILGYDDIYQSALLTYYIKILKWPQHNWIYCEGPIQYDWTKCINGYTLDYLTKRWITKEAYTVVFFINFSV